jgi:5-methyltetrahydrofolate--homocysteine methyltransferase
VIDLGVMVPADRILKAAKESEAELVGLSGLITPSLEEMAHFARDMERLGLKLPLLIGGATTSRTHTAVKIEPNYSGPTVWVPDASRAVGVAAALASEAQRPAYVEQTRADYARVREQHARKTGQKSVRLEAARANAVKVDWARYAPVVPRNPGLTALADYPLDKLVPFIDWAPF